MERQAIGALGDIQPPGLKEAVSSLPMVTLVCLSLAQHLTFLDPSFPSVTDSYSSQFRDKSLLCSTPVDPRAQSEADTCSCTAGERIPALPLPKGPHISQGI